MRAPSFTGRAFAAALATLLLGAIPAAAAPCNASIGTIASVPTVVYDPFDGVARSVTFTVEFANNGPESCSLALAVASTSPGSHRFFRRGSDKLKYLVETPGGDDYENDIDEPRGSVSLNGGVGQTKSITLRVKVPAGLIAPAGDYIDTLTLRLYRNEGGGRVAMGSDRTAPATATLERRAQVNIAGASGSSSNWSVASLDFDTLTTGEMRSAIVQVRATTGVSIKVASEHHGKLQHEVLSGDPGVPYAMKFDGQTMNLAGPYDTLVRTPPVSLDGASYPMRITVGDVSGRPAGKYQDLLTITVSPQ